MTVIHRETFDSHGGPASTDDDRWPLSLRDWIKPMLVNMARLLKVLEQYVFAT